LVGIWCVGSVGSQPVGEVVATVEFSGDGRVQGNGGVNTFHGSYEVVDGQVQFGPIAATLIAGSGPAADVESRLFAVLVGTQPFVLDGDGLTIGSGENAAELHRVSATAAADLVVVSGTVTYRERMALPPDSVLVVQVLDAPADAAATIVAEVVVTPTSQVPIAYAVALDRGTFDLGQHYTLSAQISVGDDVLFTSTGDVPVLPEPPAQTINLVLTRG
jgi:putative lipoprotein